MTHPAANRNVNAVPLHIVCVKVFMDLPRSLLRLVHAEQESFLLVRKLLLLTQFLFLFLQVLCFCATAFDSAQKCFSHDPLQGLLHVIKHDLKTDLVMGGNRKQYGSVLSSVFSNRECENKSSDICTNGSNSASLRNIVPLPEKTEFLKKKLTTPSCSVHKLILMS